MRVGEIVRNVRQVLARDGEIVRAVVVAGRDDYLLTVMLVRRAVDVFRMHDERAVVAAYTINVLIQGGFYAEMVHGAAVILEGFGSRWLAAEGGHWDVADLHSFGRCEEEHVRRIVV